MKFPTDIELHTVAGPTCVPVDDASIESSMRPYCQNREACAAKSPSRHCRRCWGLQLRVRSQSDPEIEARRRATVSARASVTTAARWTEPAYRQKMTEHARERNVFGSAGARAHRNDPAVRARSEQSRQRTLQAMSPEERRRKYGTNKGHCAGLSEDDLRFYRLLIQKRVPAAEARKMVDEEARREIARIDAEARAREARRKTQAY